MDFQPVVKRTLCHDVKKILKEYIYTLNEKSVEKLPAESVMAEKFGVSRVTIRRVLDDLEQEGLVIRIHGRGTFINKAALQINVNLSVANEFCKIIEQSGYPAKVQLLDVKREPIPSYMAEIFQLDPDSSVITVEQLHYADCHPTILSIDRIPESFFATLPSRTDWEQNSFFTVLYQFGGLVASRARTEYQAVTKEEMRSDTSAYVLMENEALLRTSGIAYDQDNHPILHGIVYYDSHYIRFNLMRSYA